jgi:hypothetical protein
MADRQMEFGVLSTKCFAERMTPPFHPPAQRAVVAE